jgi:hypothetical protein
VLLCKSKVFSISSRLSLLPFPLFLAFKLKLCTGINIFAFEAEVLGTPALLDELIEIKQMGANYVTVNFMIEQNGANASSVFNSPVTPTNASLTTYVFHSPLFPSLPSILLFFLSTTAPSD